MAARAGAERAGGVVDTHVFAVSPYFLKQNYLPADIDATLDALVADMDEAGVESALATMFVTHEDDLVGSVPAAIERHRGRVYAQVHLQPNRPDWSKGNIEAAARQGSVVGVRTMLSVFKMRPDDPRLAPAFEACARARLPVQIVFDASSYSDPDAFGVLADSMPDLTLVLSVSRARNRAALKGLARRPNVFVQLPGLLDAEAGSGGPAMLRWAARHLAPEKTMFGSDRLGREADYAAKVRALDLLPPPARAWVARQTALVVYGARLGGA